MRKAFLLVLITSWVCSSCADKLKEREAGPPNIIFILMDDHDKDAISTYEGRYAEIAPTPNIDRIAKEGIRFDRAFVTNSICAPSRAVILTGKYSHLNGVLGNRTKFDGSQVTVPKLFQKAGYQTALIGKWHLKSEPTGFDHWSILHGGNGHGKYYNPNFNVNGEVEQDTGYVTNLITNRVIRWLDQKRKNEKPFLLMYHHKAPHRSWNPDTKDIGLFEDSHIPEPQTLHEDYSVRSMAINKVDLDLEGLKPVADLKLTPEVLKKSKRWQTLGNVQKRRALRRYKSLMSRLTKDQREQWMQQYERINQGFLKLNPDNKKYKQWVYQRYIKSYLQTIQSVDRNVGRLLDYLDQSGLSENTIVVFTSDQGFFLGEHGLYDKRLMYEDPLSTPLLIKWSRKIQEGSIDSSLVLNLDLAPTLLDMAGISVPNSMQGKSLLPLTEADTDKSLERDAIYYHYYEELNNWGIPHYGVRSKRYKLIYFYTIDEWELYDLNDDPQEVNNVYKKTDYKEVREQLTVKLRTLQKKYQDHTADTITVGRALNGYKQ